MPACQVDTTLGKTDVAFAAVSNWTAFRTSVKIYHIIKLVLNFTDEMSVHFVGKKRQTVGELQEAEMVV